MVVATFEQTRIPADDSDQRDVFTRHESDIRSYCRKFSAVYVSASSATIVDDARRPSRDIGREAAARHSRRRPAANTRSYGDQGAHTAYRIVYFPGTARLRESRVARIVTEKRKPEDESQHAKNP
jgi:hypothetical protein